MGTLRPKYTLYEYMEPSGGEGEVSEMYLVLGRKGIADLEV